MDIFPTGLEVKPEGANCEKCPLNQCTFMSGYGPKTARVVLVGDVPDELALKYGKSFIGRTGKLLDNALEEAGCKRSDCYQAYACCCIPDPHRSPHIKEVRACQPRLVQEIKARTPEVVILLGSAALRSLGEGQTNITSARGSLFWSNELEAWVMPTHHPVRILKNPGFYIDLLKDIRKAIEVLTSPPVIPNLSNVEHVCIDTRNDVDKLVAQLKKAKEVACDVETASDGRLLCVGFSWKDGTAAVVTEKALEDPYTIETINRALKGKHLIGQNFKFDLKVLWRSGFTNAKLGDDTMLMHYCHVPGTRILMRNLTWKKVEELKSGDEIVAVEEKSIGHMRSATVLAINKQKANCFEIRTARGDKLIVSESHLWPIRRRGKNHYKWRTTRHIYDNMQAHGARYYLPFFVEPWDVDVSYEAGYIAGILDGEGCLSRPKKSRSRWYSNKDKLYYDTYQLSFSQKRGPVLNETMKLLQEKGIDVKLVTKRDTGVVIAAFQGSRAFLRVLGMFRPKRFLTPTADYTFTGFHRYTPTEIVEVRPAGTMEVIGVATDTETLIAEGYVSHNCLDERLGTHDLGTLSREYLNVPEYKDTTKPFKKCMELCPRDELYRYNALDTAYTLSLAHIMRRELTPDNKRVISEILYPASDALAIMEMDGVRVDIDYLNELKPALEADMKALEEEMYAMIGREINLNSPVQLTRLLYNELQLPIPGKISSDEASLTAIAEFHPFPQTLLKYRKKQKIYSTYVTSLLEHADENGRVHCTYNLDGTRTGRLSSKNPNLLNCPRDEKIRNIFVATPGYTMLDADGSQMEVRVLAYFCKDKGLIDALTSGGDFHKRTASLFFGIPLEEITKDQRQKAKALTFGVIFQKEPSTIANELGISVQEAEHLVDIFYSAMPDARKWIRAIQEEALRTGVVTTPFGRTRRIDYIAQQNRNKAMRICVNTPIQSVASDAILTALIRIQRRIQRGELGDTRLLSTVYDSITAETREDPMWIAQVMHEEMSKPVLGNVPIEVDVKAGKRWGTMQKLELKKAA